MSRVAFYLVLPFLVLVVALMAFPALVAELWSVFAEKQDHRWWNEGVHR